MTPAFPPARILALAAIFALLLVAGTFLVATHHQPWLGVEFKPGASDIGVVVTSIHRRSPNSHLAAGDTIVALAAGGLEEPLYGHTLYDGDIDLSTFAIFNQFVEHHRSLWEILKQGEIEFVFADGRRTTGRALAQRPGSDLSWRFWFLAWTGVMSFLISVAIWAFRREQIAARLMLVGASGFLYASLLAALHYSRELTLPPFWLYIGIGDNNLGIEIITYSLLALLWYYPAPLSRFPAALTCALVVAAITTNEMLQWAQFPGHAYVMQYPFAFLAMGVIAALQWRKARHEALSRASLQWFLLTILVCTGLVTILFFIPIVYTGKPLVPAVAIYLAGPLLYLGLALGIARYRLFDLERWWLEVWLWLGGGLLVIGIDVLLITFFHLADLLALGFALILAGWVYLPLRQWLFRKVLRHARSRVEDHFPLLIETLFRDGPEISFGDRWRVLVHRVFAPMALVPQSQPMGQAALTESGLGLCLPSFDGNGSYELRYREQGRRLYTPRDAALADTLLALTRRAAALWQAREEGVKTERTRIMRDLHDDVASRLLTLMHHVKEPSLTIQAREALTTLRQVIYALDSGKTELLSNVLDELQAQLRERSRSHGIEVAWQEPPSIPAVQLGAREQINLQRVLSEAASNAIKHCSPTRFSVNLWFEGAQMNMHFCNDGAILRMEDWVAGKGLSNIQNRLHEMGGKAQWTTSETTPGSTTRTCCLQITLPLPSERSP